MSRDVKIYRITGLALISPGRLRRWQKFSVEVRAVRKEDAVERVLSELGSRHKLKRSHVKILSVEEIDVSEVRSKFVRDLEAVDRWYIE
ncbi:MAG: 50S ribosomal protein L18Ae [Sulfolobales archaeon]|nr:50S ribosomal protein L18Ae [Sulfolobales archaeon]MCX8208257.1 50S ribosomal protein L18Ae [Sulfolobales archaeon]MDW8010854.1 50S ribosomal protein L18Ae [Sulfolobales archaeon]